MKFLTIRQPWASLIAVGAKTKDDDRFFSKVVVADSGCWEWQASRQKAGHGLFRVGSRTDGTTRLVKAHRWAYERLVRPLESWEALDHLCSNPPCVNPDHLDPCTRGENVRREADRRTECRHGHPWVPENLRPAGNGYMTCATCLAATRERANERRRLKRKAERA